MLGGRSDQRGLRGADGLYLGHAEKDTCYGLPASLRDRLFRDAGFAWFHCAGNGGDSVPPSLLATALLLRSHDKVSDAEAKARADFDIRWKSLPSATTNILGRAAAGDTCNVLADGMVKLMWALAQVEGISAGKWAKARGYGRYLASSIKGEAAIDWSDKRARKALQRSEGFGEYRERPVVVEHRLARLVQLGIRRSRYYFGRAKTKFQLYLAATVANLTLVVAKAGLPACAGGGSSAGSALRAGAIRSALEIVPARLAQILTLALLAPASPQKCISPNKPFRPDF